MLKEKNIPGIILLVAGAKGAVGSTIAAAVETIKRQPESILPFLTTMSLFPQLIPIDQITYAGWDISCDSLEEAICHHGVLPENIWQPVSNRLGKLNIMPGGFNELNMRSAVERVSNDIKEVKRMYPGAAPVFINLLPACERCNLSSYQSLDELFAGIDPGRFPDIAYILAAISQGVPVVNFTPNAIEVPLINTEAEKNGVPISGRDGKTGQTYLKTALASALKVRNLYVEGWYSLNILGNQDGRNLSDPLKAKEKISNKTKLLDEILGYQVGSHFSEPTHFVRIDYYPPRADNKESWDVIDISGIFGMQMSIRVNLLARDSILAAPLALDLAIWMVMAQKIGKSGLIPEMAFYYKRPVGENPPITFQEQVAKVEQLANTIINKLS